MKLQDYLLAVTVGMLSCDERRLASAKKAMEGGSVDFNSPGAIGKVSAGARTADGKMIGLFQWVDNLRGRGSLTAQVIDSRASGRSGNTAMPDTPAHIIASFAGAEVTVLQVDGGGNAVSYFLRTIFSAHTWMRASQFAQWVDAQPEQAAIWDRLLHDINESNALNELPEVAAAGVKDFLRSEEGQAHFDFDHDNLIHVVQEVLRASGQKPVITENDRKFFEAGNELRLAANPDPFTLYLFEHVIGIERQARQPESARADFLAALRDCETFARKVESPYYEAFQLAAWVLETEACSFSDITEEQCGGLAALIGREGFSEQAQSVLKSEASSLVFDFRLFGWPERRLRALLSFSIADVLGGMGSWNDMVFDGEEEESYEKVTAHLYAALRSFLMADVLNGRTR